MSHPSVSSALLPARISTTEGSIPAAEESIPDAGGSIPAAEGGRPAADGSIPAAAESISAARGSMAAASGDIPVDTAGIPVVDQAARNYSVAGGVLRSTLEFPELEQSEVSVPDWTLEVRNTPAPDGELVLLGERRLGQETYRLWAPA